jgi:competence protein ComEC
MTGPTGRTAAGRPDSRSEQPTERPDMRLVPAAASVWVGVLIGVEVRAAGVFAVTAATAVAALVVARRVGQRLVRFAALVALACLLGGVLLGAARGAGVRAGPVDELAADGAAVWVNAVLATDPQLRTGPGAGDQSAYVISRLRIETVTGRGVTTRVRTPVLLLATDTRWADLRPGQEVSARGRLGPSDGSGDVAGVLRVHDPPELVGRAGWASRLTEPLRGGLREAVAGLPADPRGLVPALVVGDESLMTANVREDMRASGLTHLTAVSGMNVTILLLAVLGLARWCGVRSYGLPIVAGLSVLGFVLLARPEPSVVRAAGMGLVAVAGLAVSGRRNGVRALATAVVVLLLVDPWLGRDPGFALSVLATAGILLLAPTWRDAMVWLPRPVAEALAVTLAAQVACAPVVVAIAGQASLAAVPANILVAPAVAPATVFGAAAALVSVPSDAAASLLGWLAGLPAGWIVLVARHGARLPGAVMDWPEGGRGVLFAAAVALGSVVVLPAVLRRPIMSVAAGLVLVVVLIRLPTPGWPPPGWLIVACDVGQGDSLVLRAAEGSAVVVDAGPDPVPVRRCLDLLGVERVPLLVLTHYHADHVEGVPGVLDGRRVDRVLVSPLADPDEQADHVRDWLREAHVPASVAHAGQEITVGTAIELRVLWPRRLINEESMANNASIVLDVTVAGVRILLTGDIEPEAQRALMRAEPDLRADVLKVPHHGSVHQQPDLLTMVGAALALVTVGADNNYGHPAPATVQALERAGATVRRTDVDGSVAVVRTSDGGLATATGPHVAPP